MLLFLSFIFLSGILDGLQTQKYHDYETSCDIHRGHTYIPYQEDDNLLRTVDKVNSSEECCEFCSNEPGCNYWTYKRTCSGTLKDSCKLHRKLLGTVAKNCNDAGQRRKINWTDNSILLIGGLYSPGSMEWFNPWDPSKNRLLPSSLSPRRVGHISASLGDARVLITGGLYHQPGLKLVSDHGILTVIVFDLVRETWANNSDIEKRYLAASTVLNGHIFVCGGYKDRQYLSNCEQYFHGKWRPVPRPMPGGGRRKLALATLDWKVYAIGGASSPGGRRLARVEVYDTGRLRNWTTLSPMPTARDGLAAAVLGKYIYACGGWNQAKRRMNICEKYDPKRNQWSAVTPMNKRRSGLSLVAVGGQLVALGGNPSPDSAEVYDPATRKWTLVGEKLAARRTRFSAVVP